MKNENLKGRVRKSFIKGNVESDNTGISKLLREREKYLTPELTKITELMWLSEGRENWQTLKAGKYKNKREKERVIGNGWVGSE